MEERIRALEESALEERIRALEENALEERIRALEENALGERLRAIEEEVTILSPLKAIAVGIRESFFATFQSGEPVGEIEDPLASWIENDIEPAADVITDACMFENGLMHDNETFTTLYGMDWQAAKELIGTPLHFYRLPLATAISNTKWF